MSERVLVMFLAATQEMLVWFRRGLRRAVIAGVLTGIVTAAATEAVAIFYLHVESSGWTHIAAVFLAIVAGYTVAIPVGLSSGLRGLSEAVEYTTMASEKLSGEAVDEIEKLGAVALREAGILGRLAQEDAGRIGRSTEGIIGGVERGVGSLIGGIGGGIAHELGSVTGGVTPGIERGATSSIGGGWAGEPERLPARAGSSGGGVIHRDAEAPGAGETEERATDAVPQSQPQSESSHLVRLQFTAVYPKEVGAGTWNSLLVYTHIATALAAVKFDAVRQQPKSGGLALRKPVDALMPTARGASITIVAEGNGITFNPKRQSFIWLEDWHRADFRFRVQPEFAGRAVEAKVAIFLDLINIATIIVPLLCLEDGETLLIGSGNEGIAQAAPHTRIFMSYSHEDAPVVLAARNLYRGLGLTILRDRDTLIPGEPWHPALMRLIEDCDIFQLFWSAHAATSPNVQEEWEHAVQLGRGDGFIKPIYWEEPLVKPPPPLAPLNFYRLELNETRAS
ncbi:MAG: hypothetical protein OJF49_003573 [Ktedonobacterales bacterium]|jgi:hypothetical protein|nr:MAG: hypothetical protein OJF49_003573 [Ktedonobacterales bacterium]